MNLFQYVHLKSHILYQMNVKHAKNKKYLIMQILNAINVRLTHTIII